MGSTRRTVGVDASLLRLSRRATLPLIRLLRVLAAAPACVPPRALPLVRIATRRSSMAPKRKAKAVVEAEEPGAPEASSSGPAKAKRVKKAATPADDE